MLEAASVDQDMEATDAEPNRLAIDSVLAPLHLFERPLALLRITNSQISLFHVRFDSECADAMGFRLHRLFDLEAMIEPLEDGSFALLFVRRSEEEAALTSRVLRTIRLAMGIPPFKGRGRIDVTAVHRHSGFIGESEDLFAELALKVARGRSIVAP
jgi:hypothetical protein